MNKNKQLINILNNIESYIGAVVFVLLTLLLTIQVFSRYFVGRAFTWAEEVGIIMFVWLIYLGAVSAVLNRKHLRIDVLLNALPFKAKKALMLIIDLICILFCAVTLPPIINTIANMMLSSAKMSITGIPKSFAYSIIPICLVLMIIRYIQDIVRTYQENEKELGSAKNVIDFEALEREMKKEKEDKS